MVEINSDSVRILEISRQALKRLVFHIDRLAASPADEVVVEVLQVSPAS